MPVWLAALPVGSNTLITRAASGTIIGRRVRLGRAQAQVWPVLRSAPMSGSRRQRPVGVRLPLEALASAGPPSRLTQHDPAKQRLDLAAAIVVQPAA